MRGANEGQTHPHESTPLYRDIPGSLLEVWGAVPKPAEFSVGFWIARKVPLAKRPGECLAATLRVSQASGT